MGVAGLIFEPRPPNFENQYNFGRCSNDAKMIFWHLYWFQIFKDQCGVFVHICSCPCIIVNIISCKAVTNMYCNVLYVPTCHIWVTEMFNWKEFQNFVTNSYETVTLVMSSSWAGWADDFFAQLSWYWSIFHSFLLGKFPRLDKFPLELIYKQENIFFCKTLLRKVKQLLN